MAESIWRFPDRGHWGNPKWAGNLSGHVYAELYRRLKPRSVCEVFSGSGTAIEVAREMGIEAFGLDLKDGFDVLRMSVLEAIGKEVAVCGGHLPYGDVLLYSGKVWGSEPHPDDLSRCASDEEFLDKLQLAVLNMREATAPGGHYFIVIGDKRRNGKYVSYQAGLTERLPASELRSVLIKEQFNTASGWRDYARMRYPRIEHEYIVLWQRAERSVTLVSNLTILARRFQHAIRATWVNTVKLALIQLGGEASLPEIYGRVAEQAVDRIGQNGNWQAKVRQVLNQHKGLFYAPERGIWAIN